MEITWLGHSCFKIKGKEVTLITDPYDESLGYPRSELAANIVTISHAHPGHSYADGIGNGPKVINGPGEYEIADVLIIGMQTFHDSQEGRERGRNTIYLIEVDELRLCHLGDIGHLLSLQQVEELGKVEILLVPIGGVSTISAKAASELVRLLNPRIVIPMHYNTEVTSWLDPMDDFLKELGQTGTVSQNKLLVTRSNLPSEGRVVVLLEYRG